MMEELSYYELKDLIKKLLPPDTDEALEVLARSLHLFICGVHTHQIGPPVSYSVQDYAERLRMILEKAVLSSAKPDSRSTTPQTAQTSHSHSHHLLPIETAPDLTTVTKENDWIIVWRTGEDNIHVKGAYDWVNEWTGERHFWYPSSDSSARSRGDWCGWININPSLPPVAAEALAESARVTGPSKTWGHKMPKLPEFEGKRSEAKFTRESLYQMGKLMSRGATATGVSLLYFETVCGHRARPIRDTIQQAVHFYYEGKAQSKPSNDVPQEHGRDAQL